MDPYLQAPVLSLSLSLSHFLSLSHLTLNSFLWGNTSQKILQDKGRMLTRKILNWGQFNGTVSSSQEQKCNKKY